MKANRASPWWQELCKFLNKLRALLPHPYKGSFCVRLGVL